MAYREDTNDWNTLNACLTEDEYGLAGYSVHGKAADIGAHIGGVTVALLVDNPDLLMVAVEPVPPNAELLRENLEINGLSNRCVVIEAAAGSGKTTVIRYGATDMQGDTPQQAENATHHAFIGNSALVYPDAPKRPHEMRIVPVVEDLGKLDFIKIDCEGGEWAYFEREPDCPLIVGEWHPTGGHVQADLSALLPSYAVTFSGPVEGPAGFTAVRR